MFFAWRFILNENILFLSKTICLFCFPVLFSNIYHKIKFTAKIVLTYAISIVKWFLGIFVYKNIFYFS